MDRPYRFATINAAGAAGSDPVFERLIAIQHAVRSGVADPETLARWDELRAGVLDLVEALRAHPFPVTRADAERRIRVWIGAFADKHWPSSAFH